MANDSEALARGVAHHQAGRLREAQEAYLQILAVDPKHADALHLLGVVASQVGNHALAVESIQRAIELNGTSSAFHSNLGAAFRDQGKLREAAECFRRALELNPDLSEARINLGNALKDQGRWEEAAACYIRALELKPDSVEAHYNLGTAFQEQGVLDKAIGCFQQALELRPGLAEAYNNLGTAFHAQGALEKSVDCFRRAVQLRPDLADAHNNLGAAFQAQGKLDDALASYQRAVELQPDYAEALNNLGSAFQDLGKMEQAINCFRRVLELKPDLTETYNKLGIALDAARKVDEAVACFRRVLELKPDYAEAFSNLANALQSQGKLDEAVDAHRRALNLKPGFAEAHVNLGNVLKDQGSLDEAVACYRQALQLKPGLSAAHSCLLHTLWYCPNYDSATIYQEHCQWYRRWAETLAKEVAAHTNDRSPNRRLRIGYVSPDFRGHCQSLFTVPLLSAHDHRQFEIVCYSDVVAPDSLTARLKSDVEEWRNIVGLTDTAVAQLVRQDQIDILVDLTMHMASNRLLVFARKPAPVQVCWLAYPGTTGLKTMDYRLTDPYLDPPGLNERYYSEQSIRLPDCFWCYDPLTDQSVVNSLPAVSIGHVTFGCLNNFCKVNAAVLQLWAQVLNAVERSRLLLLAPEGSARQYVLQILGKAGISPGRVTFVARQSRMNYLELYNQIDIGLDTFPYNGHTTSLDAFWMGVPVVTLVGATVVGRAGFCQLSNLGLPELAGNTPEQFVEVSVRLARDWARLSHLRAALRERIEKSPLMDATRFARSMEAAYRDMWQRWCAAGGRSSLP
jgi:predicted O-linked N-acetylglucosamine transferase (SPINDLY family)